MAIITQKEYIGDKKYQCSSSRCQSNVRYDDAYRFSIGISHYTPDGKKSYIQVHENQHGCSHGCSVEAVHQRINLHLQLEHGKFDPIVLNPSGEFPDAIVRSNAEYHDNPRHAALPAICCLDACRARLDGKDAYLPHVDHSAPVGRCYQDILAELSGNMMSMEQYEVGACSLEHAVEAAHAIVNDILIPYYENVYLMRKNIV